MAEHDAMLWQQADGGAVQCGLCAHRCKIADGQWGVCKVRQNCAGQLKTMTYDNVIARSVDPIEKKPLYHYLPGSTSFSIATPGCNFQCGFCQNWQISQRPREGELDGMAISPAKLVEMAERYGCASMSYTYTEPTIFFELAYDTASLARQRGLGNCFVSNGYMTVEAVAKIAPVLDAINVDLKAFSDETYRRVMHARLAPVLTCLEALVAAGVWVEVTTLVVPGMNDTQAELAAIAGFIAGRLGPDVPWHVSRFHGDFEMASTPTTPLATLELACNCGKDAGLNYVYCGNVAGSSDDRTYCPSCGVVVVDRQGYAVGACLVAGGKCGSCGAAIAGRWSAH